MNSNILKNSFSMIFSRISQPILSMLLIIIIARKMGAAELGLYSFVLSFISIFQNVSSFGMNNLVSREVAKYPEKKDIYFYSTTFLSIVLSVIVYLSLVGSLFVLNYSNTVSKFILIYGITLFASTAIGNYEGILVGLQKIYVSAIIQFIETFLRIVAGIMVILIGKGLLPLLIVMIVMRYLNLFMTSFYIIRKKISKISFKRLYITFGKKLIKESKTFALIIVVISIYWRLDTIMLMKMKGDYFVGLYNASFRLMQIGMIVPQAVAISVFPQMSHFFNIGDHNFAILVQKTTKYLVVFELMLATLVSFLSPIIINILYGNQYSASILCLIILIWTLVPYSISVIFAYALISSNNQKIDLIVNVVSLLINFTFNFLLIKKYGIIGASLATLFSSSLYLLLQTNFIRKLLSLNFYGNFLKPIIWIASPLLLKIVFPGASVLVLSLLTAGYYFLLIAKSNLISVEDKVEIKAYFKKILPTLTPESR